MKSWIGNIVWKADTEKSVSAWIFKSYSKEGFTFAELKNQTGDYAPSALKSFLDDIPENSGIFLLPVYYLIYDSSLFLMRTLQIKPRSLYIFMAEKVRQQRNVRICL